MEKEKLSAGPMNYNKLKYIIEIANTQNITRAAERLFISQSALSIYLRKLESDYGCSFFVRDRNSMILTPEGRLYIQTAQEILRLDEALRRKISLNQGKSISIGCSSELGMQILSQLSYDFREKHPDFKISLIDRRADYLMSSLKDNKLDFIIVPRVSSSADGWTSAEMLKKEELFLVLPPNHPMAHLASQDYDHPPQVDISLFKDEKFIIAPRDTVEYGLIMQSFIDHQIEPNIVLEINRTQQACQMVVDGVALTIQPSFCIPRNMNLLVCRPEPACVRYMMLAYCKGRKLRKEEQLLIDAIKYKYMHWYD